MRRILLGSAIAILLIAAADPPAEAAPFNPDTDPSRIRWADLAKALGPAPDVRGQRFGIVLKTPTNEYWRLMAAGYRRRAAADGVKLDIQAAQSESDQARQLAIMHNMVGSRYKAILISPISSFNLQPAIEEAKAAGVPVVDVDGAVVESVANFVGPVNRDMGVKVAKWFIENYPAGGKVAVVEGQAGVFSTVQRSAGFRETLLATNRFEIAASVSAQWDERQAFDVTTAILRKTPDLTGIYCNNDVMAFGAVEAVNSLGLGDRVKVFGSDGTHAAYESIRAGRLTGTVDIFPAMIGEIGLDVAERLSVGQRVPRVVVTPHLLVTLANIERLGGDDESRHKAVLDLDSGSR